MSALTRAIQIPNGASVSGPMSLGASPDAHLIGIGSPAAWTAANVAVDVSNDGATWQQAGDQYGNVFSFPVTVGQAIMIPATLALAGWSFFRLRSVSTTSAATNVPQGQAVTLTAILKSYG